MPRGKHTIKVCQGTACHVMGAKSLFDYLLDKLEIEEKSNHARWIVHRGTGGLSRMLRDGACDYD
jgi:NADH:ubiquinone oxidoreductase subunit E